MSSRDEEGRVIYRREPLKGLRKMVSSRMLQSTRDYPQGTAMLQVDMTQMIAYREKLKQEGTKVTFGDLFAKATACALEENPELNAQRTDDEILYFENINIGMMATINDVLMEPVIADVQSKTVAEVSSELSQMYENLKKGKLMRVKLDGGTFSLSNLGMFNVDGFTPLLSPPKGGILGIGSTKMQPVADTNGNITAKPMTTLSITTDHGLVDGVFVMRFLDSMVNIFENPQVYMFRTSPVKEGNDG